MRAFSLLSLFVLLAAGCTSARTSDTARTGIEQLLVSNAVDQTLDKIPFPNVEGRKVFIDPQYLESVDKGYIVASVRQRLLASGAELKDKKEDSEITMEISSGGVGTDNLDSYLGMPALAIPGPMPLNLPEVRMYQRKSHYGTAKLGVVAYSTSDGKMIMDSGRALARSDDSSWSVFGIGPIQRGTVRDEVRIAESRSTSIPTRTAKVYESEDSTTLKR